LLSHQVVWAAAGSPRAVFSLTPADLVRVTEAKVVAIAAT
jgi:prolyl-tRNA editing enzyme YbaK/EbsC (Cys-tRNA(Pro) deacylase)